MKYTTPASRAPGVSVVGMIRAAIASISTACAGVKKLNLAFSGACTAWRACVAAEQSEGQCEETQIAVRLLHERNRKSRRFRSFIIIFVGSRTIAGATLRCRYVRRQSQTSDS